MAAETAKEERDAARINPSFIDNSPINNNNNTNINNNFGTGLSGMVHSEFPPSRPPPLLSHPEYTHQVVPHPIPAIARSSGTEPLSNSSSSSSSSNSSNINTHNTSNMTHQPTHRSPYPPPPPPLYTPYGGTYNRY